MIHGSGTMVFSVLVRDQMCADWVHVDVLSLPDVSGDDPVARHRSDSVWMHMVTRQPTWPRCTL
jgi:hypothetical protein